MRPRTSLQLAALAIAAAVAAVAAAQPRPAADAGPPGSYSPAAAPPPAASASAAASGAAAGPSASVPAPPPRAARRFLEGFPTDERSPKPAPEEWGAAPPMELSRPSTACKAFRIREYVRITCLQGRGRKYVTRPRPEVVEELYGVRVVAGSEEGVELIKPVWDPRRKYEDHGVDILIPVRPGDRRALAIAVAIPVWKSPNPDEGVSTSISEMWLPGDPGPTIVAD